MLTKTTTKVKALQTPQQLITNHYSEKKRNAMEWLAQNLLFIKTKFFLAGLFNKVKWIGLVVLGVLNFNHAYPNYIIQTDSLCEEPVINAINILNDECLLLNVSIDEMCCTSLTKSNFTIFQNEVEQTIYEVLQPGDGGGSRLVDIVFVIDVSGSMSGDIRDVRDNMGSFLTTLETQGGIDYAVGIVIFTQGGTNVRNQGNLYLTDGTQMPVYKPILDGINQISTGLNPNGEPYCSDSGSNENSIGGMYNAATLIKYRPGAQKIFLLLSDEPPCQISDEPILNISSIIDDYLAPNDIIVYPIFKRGEGDNSYIFIADQTNPLGAIIGETYFDNIRGNFDNIAAQIEGNLINTYVITYCTDELQIDTTNIINVLVDCGVESFSITDTTLVDGCPQIELSETTVNYINQFGISDESDLTIEINVIDNIMPTINEVVLFYQVIGEENYTSVLMESIMDDLWSFTISAGLFSPPGINFYFTATDGTCSISMPEVDPTNFPYQIGVLPNEKPLISHNIITDTKINTSIEICADITDNTDSLLQAILYYRVKPGPGYIALEMENIANDTYCATIPSNDITCAGIDYYIYALDNQDLAATEGTANFPITFFPSVTPIPSNLSATILNANHIELTWTDNSLGYENFIIERTVTADVILPFNSEYEVIATTSNGITSYIDTIAIDVNQNYWYRVRNENACNIGEAIYAMASLSNLCDLLGCDCEDCDNCQVVLGCTDPLFCEYNPAATCNDVSCQTPNTDPGTCQQDCNFDIYQIWDAETCTCVFGRMNIKGCMDEMAINYNPEANCEPEDICIYPTSEATFPCNILGTWLATDLCPSRTANPQSEPYTVDVLSLQNNTILAFTNLFGFGFDIVFEAQIQDDQFVFPLQSIAEFSIYGSGNLTENADSLNWQFTVATYDSVSTCTSTWVLERADGANAGCTDMRAYNFSPDANCEDGSCIYDDPIPGCTDLTACNFRLAANYDDGSCTYPAFCFVDCNNIVVNLAFMWGALCDDADPNTPISYMNNCTCVGFDVNIGFNCVIEPEQPNVVIGEAYCMLITVTDTLNNNEPLANTPVNFLIEGANEGMYAADTTDANGQVRLCYIPTNSGVDFITVTSGNFTFTFGSIVFDFDGGINFDLDFYLTFGHIYNGVISPTPPTEIPVGESICTTVTILDEDSINVLAGVQVTIISTIDGVDEILVNEVFTTNLNGQIEFCPSSPYIGIEECILTTPFSSDTIRYNWVEIITAGCTDQCAPNYNPTATEDDGSCEPYDTCPENTCFSTYTWDTETCVCKETVIDILCEDIDECVYEYVDPATCECVIEPIDGCSGGNNCNSEPGLMQTAKSFVCDGDFIYLSEAFSIVSENSVKAYLLHEEEEFKGENYIEISKTGRFESPGSFYNNLTLYVSAIMGPADSRGNPELDHRCTEWTPNSAPIVFLDPITVNLIEERCEGELYYVDVSIQGGIGEISPRFAYSSATDGKTSYQNISKDEILTFGPYPQNGNYTIEVEGAKGCTGSWSSPYICEEAYQVSFQSLNNVELLLLDHINPDIKINEAILFNANGQVTPADIFVNGNQCVIKINYLVKGIFFVQLMLNNNEIDYVKIIKQ